MIVEGDEGQRRAKSDPKAPTTLASALAELDDSARRLQRMGILFPLVLFGQAVGLAMMMIQGRGHPPDTVGTMKVFALLNLLTAAAGVVAAFRFDNERKRGEDLFSVVSDELQHSPQPGIDVRLTLKRFVHSTEVPLLPIRSGLFTYVLLYVAAWLLQVWLLP